MLIPLIVIQSKMLAMAQYMLIIFVRYSIQMTNNDLILDTTSETSRTARVPKSEVDLAGLAGKRTALF